MFLKGYLVTLFTLLLATSALFAKKEQALLQIGKEKISAEEFLWMYKKNNLNLPDSLQKSPEEYIDLFVNFKLKVLEAEELGLDTMPGYKKELEGYRKELVAPYLTDSVFDEALIRETYRRMTHEVKASHLLIAIPGGGTPADTLKAWNRSMQLRDSIRGGANFEELAKKYSADPSAKRNGGLLGYFGAFAMVFPFEEAAFKTPVGSISNPVRSRFGYHLIKVDDYRESQGEILTAHIMAAFRPGMSEVQKATKKAKIDSLYQLLEKGANFAQLAHDNTDDRRSAERGGQLPWFTAGRMVPEYSQAAFKLKQNGDYTLPVRTNYGWHIIKQIDRKLPPSFEEAEADIKEKLQESPERNTQRKEAFIEKLKTEYGFSSDETIEQWFWTHEKTVPDSLCSAFAKIADQKLFQIGEEVIPADSFFTQLQAQNNFRAGTMSAAEMKATYEVFKNQTVLKYEERQLPKKYPEYRNLLREYHDGLLLFEISEQKVWSKAMTDTVGLKHFFEQNKTTYQLGKHFEGAVITCASEEVKSTLQQHLASGIAIDSLPEATQSISFQIEKGIYLPGDNPSVDFYIFKTQPKATINFEKILVHGTVKAAAQQPFEEVRGQCMADYQTELEKQWIVALREKFAVKVNKSVLRKIETK